ncbi:MAG: energy transducer TonB [Chitinophagaceae bacterium]|nr:energy transducer TonB [Chitinophagaceae bacterium]
MKGGKLTVYPPNDAAMMHKYGSQAKYGVVVIEDGVLVNAPINQSKITEPENDSLPVFTKAEVMPQFPGGEAAWNRYISNFLTANTDKLHKAGETGTCIVRFVVEKDGSIKKMSLNFTTLPVLNEIAGEAILKGPKWVPAIQNGHKVRCWTEKKITFKSAENATTKDAAADKIVITNQTVRILYIGINNEITISSGNIPEEKLQVTVTNGSIKKTGTNTWISNPSSPGEAVITVSKNDNGKTVELIKSVFKVKNVPDPAIALANSKGGRVKADDFKTVKAFTIDEDWEITHYTFYFTGKGFDKPLVIPAQDNVVFNERVLTALAKCEPGTTVVVDEIKSKLRKADIVTKLPTVAFNLY